MIFIVDICVGPNVLREACVAVLAASRYIEGMLLMVSARLLRKEAVDELS